MKPVRWNEEKKQTTIRFAVSDLAIIKARAKEMGIGYQNLIQTLVHNYAHDKTKLGLSSNTENPSNYYKKV